MEGGQKMLANEELAGRRRLQSVVDIVVSIVLAMLVWPFPIARATLSVPAQLTGICVVILVVQLLYFAGSTAVWQHTLGMRMAGVRLAGIGESPVSRGQAVRWAVVSSLLAYWFTVAPSQATRVALAERVSGTTVVCSD